MTMPNMSVRDIPDPPLAWVGQDGMVYAIEEMTDHHLQCCIGMIFRKNNGWRARFMAPMLAELKKRKKLDALRRHFSKHQNLKKHVFRI